MALKNMIKVGDKVTFGRSGEEKLAGTVIKCNPKTARIKVARKGTFDVTYNLIQKGRGAKANPDPTEFLAQKRREAAKKKKAPAKKKKVMGKPICAVPVKPPRAKKAKKNPPKKGSKRLVHEDSGREVVVGEILTDFRGEKWKIHDWREGQPPSSGRVYVTDLDEGFERAFYPSVFNLEWKPHMFAMKGGKENPPRKKGRAASVGTRNGLKWIAEIVDPGGPLDGLHAPFYSMEELNIVTKKKAPGKQIDIYRMDNGKYYKSIRIPKSGPLGRAKIEADKKKRARKRR